MIVTVTLNPAMDKTVVLERLLTGDTNRVQDSRTDPGGKGINVSRVVNELGGETLAMGFVSGGVGRFIEHSLNEIGIFDDFIHTPGQTRTNTTILETETGVHTIIAESGPQTDRRYVHELFERLRKRLRAGHWLVAAGSLPPGIPRAVYADLVAFGRERGAHTVLDADGPPLHWGIAARPYLIKPNRTELARLMGREPRSLDEVVEMALTLRREGIGIVVVSLGKDGSVAVGEEGVYRAIPPTVPVVSAVGSGDSMVAGLVLSLQRGLPLEEGLRLGTAAGAATALTPGTVLCQEEDVARLLPQVIVERM